MPIPEESVSEFARRTVATVDTKTFRKDNIARLIVFDSIANSLKSAKPHYDQICQIVNSYPNGRKYQEIGQAMNSRNYFQEGNRRLKLDLPYESYYSEIWGKVSAVSRLIFPFSTIDFCWHWLLFPLRIHLIEMKPRTKAGRTLLLFFARSPSISWKKSSFSPPCSRQYSIRR